MTGEELVNELRAIVQTYEDASGVEFEPTDFEYFAIDKLKDLIERWERGI